MLKLPRFSLLYFASFLSAIINWLPFRQVEASIGRNYLLQAPQLTAPGRGSLAGALAGKQWNSQDLARGALGFAFPGSIPQDRGPSLIQVLPSYTPEQGLSEWGLGWGVALSMIRFRSVGEPNFDDSDDFISPWGRLVRGKDDAWYAADFKQYVRAVLKDSSWEVTTADGTRYWFTSDVTISGVRGIYAWYITSAEDVVGHRTVFTYDIVDGYPYLSSVSYGGWEGKYTQRLVLKYEPIKYPYVRYDSGSPVALRQRVYQLSVESLHTATHAWQDRFRYSLTYIDDTLSLAFYLQQVVKSYPSGSQEPPVTFEHQFWQQPFETQQAYSHTKLESYAALAHIHPGSGSLNPHKVTFFDANGDGRMDVESTYDYALLEQTDTGWLHKPLPPSSNADPRCRPSLRSLNPSRVLARLIPGDAEHYAFSATPIRGGFSTELFVCNRAGELLHTDTKAGAWQLGLTRRLVDINGDHAPDLIWAQSGHYGILVNEST